MMLLETVGILLCSFSQVTRAVSLRNAEDGFTALQQFYNESIGLWIPSTGWWNSANCLTVIADLAAIDPSVKNEGASIWQNTFTQAQKYNLQMQKVVEAKYLPCSYYDSASPSVPQDVKMPQARQTNGFLNDYYDDEGWWALAWIAVYDVTGEQDYLITAQSIFDDMDKAYGTTPCGGLWWDKQHTYVNAIANELYIDVAAHLATRSQSRSTYYLDRAKEGWNWFRKSGMINAQWNINDGLDSATCTNNNGTVWTYNQGVILGALTELSEATGDIGYITTAKRIADAGIANLTNSNGILHEPCEPDCGGDGSQFKGIFTRNLRILQQESPEERYADFLDRNADSVWQKDRNDGNEFGLVWDGPFVGPANASTQSSGLDVIVAALST
ncbi:hypothetical protein E2P81_ATG10414 [Venturia nashicola]|nr:hypothetical protein E2P81_ATG10414 [Venturia nashicola]